MRTLVVALVVLAFGCEAPPLERSCAGERVNLCGPYEHSVVLDASMEPAELPVADFSMSARIHVELARCADAPAPHAVELFAIVPNERGEPTGITSLVTLREGRDGDPVEGDGVLDVTVVNPLLVTIPEETDIVLRFTPRSSTPMGCTGEPFEIPYRTGPFRSAD